MGAIYCFAIGELQARALLHMVLTVAPGSPGLAAVVAGVRFELEVHAEVVHHVAQLRHALWTVVAEVESFRLACFLVADSLLQGFARLGNWLRPAW